MTADPWPNPADSPMERVRMVAGCYREQLKRYDPELTARIDEQMIKWGQSWVCLVSDPDQWVSARGAAEILGVLVSQVAALRRAGRLPGRRIGNSGRRWEYLARDVLTLSTHPRKRTERALS